MALGFFVALSKRHHSEGSFSVHLRSDKRGWTAGVAKVEVGPGEKDGENGARDAGCGAYTVPPAARVG